MQGLVTPQDQMQGGKRKRRSDSPGAWRKRRGDDMSEGPLDAPPPPKRSSNNKVPAPLAMTGYLCYLPGWIFVFDVVGPVTVRHMSDA